MWERLEEEVAGLFADLALDPVALLEEHVAWQRERRRDRDRVGYTLRTRGPGRKGRKVVPPEQWRVRKRISRREKRARDREIIRAMRAQNPVWTPPAVRATWKWRGRYRYT